MDEIPPFREAVRQLRGFLASRGHPGELAWVFREDFYSPGLNRYVVRTPLPEENERLAEIYFETARDGGLVQLRGVFRIGDASGVTVWSPTELGEEIQGWSRGLKLSVAQPFVAAQRVESGLAWWLHRLTKAYRLNQARGFDVPRRGCSPGPAPGPPRGRPRG